MQCKLFEGVQKPCAAGKEKFGETHEKYKFIDFLINIC